MRLGYLSQCHSEYRHCHPELVSGSKTILIVMLDLFQHLKIYDKFKNMLGKFAYYVYILTNKNNTTFYIGVTNNIVKRLFEHRTGLVEGFTKKYKLKKLVYLEEYSDIKEAIAREKQLKNWHRDWKLNLIKKVNPQFNDLSVFQ